MLFEDENRLQNGELDGTHTQTVLLANQELQSQFFKGLVKNLTTVAFALIGVMIILLAGGSTCLSKSL